MDLLQFIHIFGATEEATGIAALGIDPLAILAQAGTFLVLFLIIKKFALKGIVSTLEKRRQTIDNGVRLGQKMEAEHAQLQDKIAAELQKARGQADEIMVEAHQEAGKILQAAESKTAEKVETMLKEAQNRIDAEVQRAKRELEKDTLALVAHATEVIISEKLDTSKDARLISRALEEAKVQ